MPKPSTPGPAGPPRGTPASGAASIQFAGVRFAFYRDQWRAVVLLLPLVVIALLISLLLNVYLALRPVKNVYFGVTPSGQMTALAPLDQPYLRPEELMQWAGRAVVAAHTFDAVNYRDQLNQARQYFTTEGFEQYVGALKSSGTLETITKNVLIASAAQSGPPVISKFGTDSGVHFWEVQVPLTLRYYNAKTSNEFRRMVTVKIIRMPTHEAPLGVGVSQVISRDL
jgi:intracellular multiplication protein IcmL